MHIHITKSTTVDSSKISTCDGNIISNTYKNVSVLCIGKFGRVFKGTWTHQSSVDGKEVSEEVAIKTIKSIIVWINYFTHFIIVIL